MTRPHDPDNFSCGPSEFSWGKGLTPKWAENLPPDQGGRYKPLSPPSEYDPFANIPDANTPFTGAS